LIDALYPLAEYLRNEFPAEIFYVNERRKIATQDNIPDNCHLIKDTGGSDQPWIRFTIKTVQIITRNIDGSEAKGMAEDIYNKIHGRFGLVLPQAIVGSRTYQELETTQINGIQKPFGLGVDENSRSNYTTNYQLYYDGE
jgi:hypothetical protein